MRRGTKRAILDVAHSILVMAYDMSQRQESYREARVDFFAQLQPEDGALDGSSNAWDALATM